MLFTGTYEHQIDAKQRLAIPSEIRGQLSPETDGPAMYAVVCEGPTLCLYTERGFEKRAEDLDRSEWPADKLLAYEQVMFSLASRLELDKQGRVRLPENLLKMVKLDKDIVLIGVKDHLELHDRQAWQTKMQEVLASQPQLLMNPRRAMKPAT